MEIDGTYGLAVQTRVEQPLRIPQLGTLWKCQPHRVLEGLADADDAVVGPDWDSLGAGGLLPLHLFDYAGVGAPDESPQLAQPLTPPAGHPGDNVIYLLGRGCVAHFDALLRMLSTQRTEGLSSLSLRWMQPSQQHGRRFASNSSGGNRWMCWLRETLGWQSGRVSNPPGLYVPLRRRSPWSSSIAHRSLDAVRSLGSAGARQPGRRPGRPVSRRPSLVESARDPRAPRGRAPRRGRALARVRLDDRPPGGDRACRHRDDRLEARGRRYEPDAAPREHPARRGLRHQHPPAFRPLRRQPPLPGRADPRPVTRARRRAFARRLHDPRMGRLRRRDVCRARGRGGAATGNPPAAGARTYGRASGGRRRD